MRGELEEGLDGVRKARKEDTKNIKGYRIQDHLNSMFGCEGRKREGEYKSTRSHAWAIFNAGVQGLPIPELGETGGGRGLGRKSSVLNILS